MRYLVKTPWGTFKRSSVRGYQFVVISCGTDEAVIRARMDYSRKHWESQLAKYEEGIRTGVATTRYEHVENYPQYAEEMRARLAKHPANLERELAENAALIASKRGHYESWCSRFDLADAAARRAVKSGRLNVQIYSCVNRAPYTEGQLVRGAL